MSTEFLKQRREFSQSVREQLEQRIIDVTWQYDACMKNPKRVFKTCKVLSDRIIDLYAQHDALQTFMDVSTDPTRD